MNDDVIRIRGARQNNLRGLDLDLPLGELIVVDRRVSGSGKSSLAFDTRLRRRPAPLRRDVLAVRAAIPRPHGQAAGRPHRRHPARDRDRPDESRAHVALDRRHDDGAQRSPEAPVRARRGAVLPQLRPRGAPRRRRSRSTRSWRTSRASQRRSRACWSRSRSTCRRISAATRSSSILTAQGYTRIHARTKNADRGHPGPRRVRRREPRAAHRGARDRAQDRQRLRDRAHRDASAKRATSTPVAVKFSAHRHCAHCDIAYETPSPNSFSFNSPLGACEHCRGFGRTIGIDYRLVIPDEDKTLARRRHQAVADEEQQGVPGRPACATRSSAAFPSTCRGASSRRSSARWVIDGEGSWRQRSGTASRASSRGSNRKPTRCTCACCCRSTAATTRARPAAARGSSPIARLAARLRSTTPRAVLEPERALSRRICRRFDDDVRSRRCRVSRCTTS